MVVRDSAKDSYIQEMCNVNHLASEFLHFLVKSSPLVSSVYLNRGFLRYGPFDNV